MNTSFSIGPVELNVKDVPIMKKFYHDDMGLDILKEESKQITLGKTKTPLLILHNKTDLPSPQKGSAGLYHFAILFSSRGDLARTIHRILKTSPQFFSGSADHLVSEAFYFTDPEGNGIELYFDRDRSTWQWEQNQIKMASMYIDPVEYLQRYIVLEENKTKTSVGHIHLKVGNITEAKKFYVDALGFDITAELPQALFISVGGYHHHIGLNTWESLGAKERTESLGLKNIQFMLSDKKEYDEIKKRVHSKKVTCKESPNAFMITDPWNNQITVSHHTP